MDISGQCKQRRHTDVSSQVRGLKSLPVFGPDTGEVAAASRGGGPATPTDIIPIVGAAGSPLARIGAWHHSPGTHFPPDELTLTMNGSKLSKRDPSQICSSIVSR